jgi:hypothetical protein
MRLFQRLAGDSTRTLISTTRTQNRGSGYFCEIRLVTFTHSGSPMVLAGDLSLLE